MALLQRWLLVHHYKYTDTPQVSLSLILSRPVHTLANLGIGVPLQVPPPSLRTNKSDGVSRVAYPFRILLLHTFGPTNAIQPINLRLPTVTCSRNLHTRHLQQIDSYDARVEEQLRESGFYHVSQIGRIMPHGPTIDALVERWRPETHTFHLPHGECTITLEDVAMIFGLRTHGLLVTGIN
nr:uncharacterized protein LOC112789547 [Arachis hypogaea]